MERLVTETQECLTELYVKWGQAFWPAAGLSPGVGVSESCFQHAGWKAGGWSFYIILSGGSPNQVRIGYLEREGVE